MNNQLTGYVYDAAGNMTSDPTDGVSLNYDQENRITGASGYAYAYDANGNRVLKTNGSTGTLYWYMSPGIVAESDLLGVLKSEYVFFDGERVARRDNPTGTSPSVAYYFSDHLKTASVITDSQGHITSESDYYPWGGELQFLANDSNHYKFTGKERDETGLDYFGARYYSNGLARFITPDWSSAPVPVPYADLDDPQSLNQFSYVRNVPTSKADQDGHETPTLELVSDAAVSALIRQQALKFLIRAGARLLLEAVAVVTVAQDIHELSYPSTTANQSDGDESAAMQQASRERAAENGGVDPQQPTELPAASGGARKGGKGGENSDAELGREKHQEFFDKAKAKGWQVEPRLTDPETGKTVKPDTLTNAGKPVELKPKTNSGRAAGKRQLRKYERATGKKGRVVYYDKNKK